MTRISGRTSARSATTGVGGEATGTRRIELPVSGLTCAACVQTVERALQALPGVTRATVNLAGGRAFVEYDPALATVAALLEAIKTAGYRTETAKTRFRIEGITCASCVTKIFGILLSPLLAALAMSFSSVTVITNANRLKRWRPS